MQTKNLFPRLGEASRKAWACLGVALRSRVPFALIAALDLISVGQASAQTFTTLHTFTGGGGSSPFAGLVLSSNTLYGTTFGAYDDGAGYGTVFAVSTDGTGFMNLPNFGGGSLAGLILSGNTLYGTTAGNQPFTGTSTVFAINTDGTDFTNLHSFTPVSSDYAPFINADGTQPRAGLMLSGDTLYGTAYFGGGSGNGTIFKVSTNGTGFTVLQNGGNPQAGLILSGNTLYGTTFDGGSSGWGSVFGVNTDGTGFTNLHSFTALDLDSRTTNIDGAYPEAGLMLSGNTLYGTAYYGGSSGNGTVFAVNTNGTGFTNLHSFTAITGPLPGTNSDGANPSGLILSGNTLYGTANRGGISGDGTVFAVNTDGTGFTSLYSFTGGSDGGNPNTGLILSGNTFYGTTHVGTVFSLSFRPQLTITPFGTNVILSWPANVAGFDYTGYRLQSTTNLVSTAFWSTNSPAPVVIAGRNTVTNPITANRQFYRLAQ